MKLKDGLNETEKAEYLKYRLNVRTILLDKLILAILLAAFGLFLNRSLESYKTQLQSELEIVKAQLNYQTALSQRRLKAYEEVWVSISDMLNFIRSTQDRPLTKDQLVEMQRLQDQLSKQIIVNNLYLDTQSQIKVIKLQELFKVESTGMLPIDSRDKIAFELASLTTWLRDRMYDELSPKGKSSN